MMLTANNIAYYLIERGLITPQSVVDGDLMIVESSSRNRNFKIIRKEQPGYFVKQVQQWEPQAIGLLQREANFYWLTANDGAFASVSTLSPQYYFYDAIRHALVVGLLPEGENLSEYHRRLGVFPLAVATLVGEALGTCQRHVKINDGDNATNGLFPRQAPWILSAHRLGNTPQSAQNGGNQQVLSIIQRYADFHDVLDTLRAQWQANSLIHGDMKWDNCLVYSQNDQLQLKIIDWETADWGDACWDVGAILQAYLTFWIMSIPVDNTSTPAQFLERAPYPIEAMQPAIRAFWQAYLTARGISGAAGRELLVRSVQYGAARMLQTAYEYMYYAPQISANALCQLQVSLNILSNPHEAIRELLALSSA